MNGDNCLFCQPPGVVMLSGVVMPWLQLSILETKLREPFSVKRGLMHLGKSIDSCQPPACSSMTWVKTFYLYWAGFCRSMDLSHDLFDYKTKIILWIRNSATSCYYASQMCIYPLWKIWGKRTKCMCSFSKEKSYHLKNIFTCNLFAVNVIDLKFCALQKCLLELQL